MNFLNKILIFLNYFLIPINSLILHCEFKNDPFYGYSCYVKSLHITSKSDRTITQVTGNHLSGKVSEDVKFFECRGKNLNFFPIGLENFFNLDSIYIFSSNLTEITGDDLKSFDKLKVLYLWDNNIPTLKADLLNNNPKIRILYLSSNKIKKVEKGTLTKRALKLVDLDFELNECFVNYAFTGGIMKEEYKDGKKIQITFDSILLAEAIEETCG